MENSVVFMSYWNTLLGLWGKQIHLYHRDLLKIILALDRAPGDSGEMPSGLEFDEPPWFALCTSSVYCVNRE